MVERLIEELQKHEREVYNSEDCEAYGCPYCNDFDKLIKKEVLKPKTLYVNICPTCNKEFMVLNVDKETKSLCTKHPYKGISYVVKNDLPNYVSFESKEIANKVSLMFHDVFEQSKNVETLENKFCISKFVIKEDEAYPNCLLLKFEYNAFKTIDFLNVLNALVAQNNNNINEKIIQKALDIKLSVLNLWQFEFARKLEDLFSFEKIIKAIVLFEQNKLDLVDIINFQNAGLYMGTILHISSCIEKYSEDEDLKDLYKEQVIKALNQIYSYLSNRNFDFCEDVEKKAKFENLKCLLQIMLIADFE
jgi:hypothetical protein